MGAQAHYVTANDVRNGLRDLSLIMGRRGQVKFNPYKKAGGGGGGRKSFSHAEEGAEKVLR